MSASRQAAKLKKMLRLRKRRGIREWKAHEDKKAKDAILIQKNVRRMLVQVQLDEKDYAIEFIQAPTRGLIQRRRLRRQRFATNRLQRIYRGAKTRLSILRMAKAVLLVQRVFRSKLSRLRRERENLYHSRVVHTKAATARLLARSKLLWDMGQWRQYRDPETDSVWYYHEQSNETRWKAPECFEGAFVCGFDDCVSKPCAKTFNTQQELDEHRKEHQWVCDACWWSNDWTAWPTCNMCGNICNSKPINLPKALERRHAERERARLAALQRKKMEQKRIKERARRIEAKKRSLIIKREREETRLMQQEDYLWLSKRNIPNNTQQVGGSQQHAGANLENDDVPLHIKLVDASATEIVEALFGFAAELCHVYPLKNGMSVHRYDDGSLYVGEMLDSSPHGKGELVTPVGDKYKGEWQNGKRHGMGRLETSAGLHYNGPWKYGARHGLGILTMPNGDVFEGYWNHGVLEGQGRFVSGDKNGDVYEGNWRRGMFDGIGTYRKENGDVYTGTFEMGQVTIF